MTREELKELADEYARAKSRFDWAHVYPGPLLTEALEKLDIAQQALYHAIYMLDLD